MSRARKALRGAVWMSGASYISAVMSFVGNLVLARILLPEDFGTFAFAVATLTIVFMISGFGTQEAIVQCRDESIEYLIPTAFWMTIILGVFLASVGSLLGLFLYSFTSQIVGQLIIALSWLKFLQMLNHAYSVTLQRDLAFRPLAVAQITAQPLSFFLAIFVAYIGFGVWSLFLREAVFLTIVISMIYKASDFRLSLQFSIDTAKWIWHFGWKVMVLRISEIIFGQWDNLIVGRFLGISVLGHYSLAYQLAFVGKQFTEKPIQAIAFSTYASAQKEKYNLEFAFEKTSYWLSRSSLLIALLVWFCGRDLILFLYGNKWDLASAVFQAMFIFIGLLPLQSNIKEFIIGSGNIRRLLWIQFVQLLLFVPGLFIAVSTGDLVAVAWSLNLIAIFTFLLLSRQVNEISSINWRVIFAKPILVSFTSTLISLLVLPMFNQIFPDLSWFALVLQIAFICFLYLFLLYISERKIFHEEFERIRFYLAR